MQAERKRLVVLCPAFPGEESETHWVPSQQLLVRTLAARFPSVEVVVLAFLLPARSTLYRWHGIRVYAFGGFESSGVAHGLLWMKIWRRLRALRREGGLLGIFSCWCGECALIGKYFGAVYGVPHYTWISGQDARPDNHLVRYIRPRPESLAAMSAFLSDTFYQSHGIRPGHLIPNGIDPEEFPAPAAERTIDLLGVGSLNPLKRYGTFVEIAGALSREMPGLRAVHCGDGPESARLRLRAKELGLEGVLHLAGAVSHEEILSLMTRTRILLHPSAYEGCSTVCLEALYAGAHVVSFCHPGGPPVPHWHHVRNTGEMLRCALDLLQGPADHGRVVTQRMSESADAVMRLFGVAARRPVTGGTAENVILSVPGAARSGQTGGSR